MAEIHIDHAKASELSGQNSQQYKDILAQVQGSRFADVLKANPYNATSRTQTFWDRLLNKLGFRSGYDKAIDQMNLASAEYNAQVAQTASEEEYNSEQSQVNRARAAGLNPDLTGISPAGASEFDNTPNTPDINAQVVSAQDVAGFAMNVYSLTAGFMKNMQEYKILENSVIKGDIENVTGMLTAGLDLARFSGDPNNPEAPRDNNSQWKSIYKYFRSGRSRKLFSDALGMAEGSLPASETEYNSRFNIADKRTGYNKLRASSYYDEFDAVQRDLFSPIVQYAERNAKRELDMQNKRWNTEETTLEAQQKQAEYQMERTVGLDASASAEAENSANELQIQNNDQQKELRSVMAQIIHNLAKSSADGNKWASIALVILQGFFSMSGSIGAKGVSVGF